MSVKAEALYALAAYRRLLRGTTDAADDDGTIAAAEEAIKSRPDPDVMRGVPPERGGDKLDDESRKRIRRQARRKVRA